MTNSPAHRVVITGIGSVNALGHDVAATWQQVCAGTSAIGQTTRFDPSTLNIKVSGEIKNFDAAAHFDERTLEWLDRFSQLALVATREAVGDAGIGFADGLGDETAVIIASGVGGFETIDMGYNRLLRDGMPRARPSTVPRLMISAAASQVSMEFGIKGAAFCVSSACSSSNHAIGEAYWMVRTGRVRAAVTGGAEAMLTENAIRTWESLRVMAPDTCRPFSAKRRGMVLGEGAGILVLERLEDAQQRGAPIYGEIAGYGLSADAGDIVMPDQHGAARAMTQALQTGGLQPEDIDYVNAHGTGTDLNDKTETAALKIAFGDHARRLAVSSTKSLHGHALGAAGALEAVIVAKAMREGVVPPTANYLEPDPACDLDYVPNEARQQPIRAALSNSFAFGGLNAVLAFRAH